jgi:hypothetical protein
MALARSYWTPITHEPRAHAAWSGYLRRGSAVEVFDGPLGHDGCPEQPELSTSGWYEVDGGYLCIGRGAALSSDVAQHPRWRPQVSPALDAGMPYRYAVTRGATAVLRRAPGVVLDDDLAETPSVRRLSAGMYVALDRLVRAQSGRAWWRTQSQGHVPAGALRMVEAPRFHGVVLGDEVRLPLAFVIAEGARFYRPHEGREVLDAHAPRLSWHAVLADEGPWIATDDGRRLRRREVQVVRAHAPPDDLGVDERWIDVNLDGQFLVAFEGPRPVYATLVSTGRPYAAGAHFETVQGLYRIQQKHVSATMDGESATGRYSIEDVPWTQYFYGSFALHGTFWHSGFGRVHSHGCVNLAPDDARWLFYFTSPTLFDGWHGVYTTPDEPGTRVYVHYDRQALGTARRPRHIPSHKPGS